MVIELLGIPSCGKSTYIKKYLNQYNAIAPLDLYLYSSSRFVQNINKVKLMLYAFVHRRKKALVYNKIFRKINFTSPITKFKMWLYLFSMLGAKWKAQDKYLTSNIILDEGPNQVIWGMLYNQKDSVLNVWILHKALIPEMSDKIIYFRVERRILYERLIRRNVSGGSELEHDIKRNEKVLDNAIHNLEEIIYHLEQYGMKRCIEEYLG